MSILTYKYKAVDSVGTERKGAIHASTEQDAFRKIRAAGLTPVKLTQVIERPPLFSFQNIKESDIADLTRELCVLVEAKIPLDRGLVSIAEHDGKPALTTMVRDIATQIESGSALTAAMGKYRQHFGEVYIETLRAAEKSGNLSGVMSHLATLMDRQIETKQQLKRAMTYPVIVMSVVFIAVSVIVVFVVPKFATIFADQGVKMPFMTRVIQSVGDSAKEHWYVYLFAMVAVIFGIITSWRSAAGRPIMERLLLKVPYIGRIVVSVTAGRFARVLSIGLTSGLDVIDSVEIGGKATGRPVFVAECASIAAHMRQGQPMAEAVRESIYLPSFAKRMLSAGKDSTELAKACDVIANHYDREASHLTKNVNTVIEPILTVVMAIIVLVVALSVFLPMWGMVKLHH